MSRPKITFLTLLLILAAAAPVNADEVLTVAADSTLDGHAGYVVHSTPTGYPGSSFFLFEEAGKLRFYATRGYGSQDWDIVSSPQYIVPTSAMSIGDTWDYLDSDPGEALRARVTAQENVITPAGTFSCFRVDIDSVTDPGVLHQTMWFAWDVGFVRTQGYQGSHLDWRDELQSFSVPPVNMEAQGAGTIIDRAT